MKNLITLSLLSLSINAMAQGNITPDMLRKYEKQTQLTAAERAISNALAAGPVSGLALNQANQVEQDT